MANKPTEKEILNSLQDLYDILLQLIEKGIVGKVGRISQYEIKNRTRKILAIISRRV